MKEHGNKNGGKEIIQSNVTRSKSTMKVKSSQSKDDQPRPV